MNARVESMMSPIMGVLAQKLGEEVKCVRELHKEASLL